MNRARSARARFIKRADKSPDLVCRVFELRHRFQIVLGGVEYGVIGKPGVGLGPGGRCGRSRGHAWGSWLSATRIRPACRARIGDRFVDKFDLVKRHGDQARAHAKKTTDTEDSRLDVSALVGDEI